MNAIDIKWPIYKIGVHDNMYNEMGVDYIKHSGKISILDNKNLKGDSLGIRRLAIPRNEIYNLKRVIFMFSELLADIGSTYIDSNGNIFKYKKSKFVPLVWKLVKNSELLKTITLLRVEGIPHIFELPTNYWLKYSEEEEVYLGLLNLGNFYIIYDLVTYSIKDTRRKI